MIGSMNVADRFAPHRSLQRFFPFFFVTTLAVICHFVATTPVVLVPREFPFGLVKALPLEYWVAAVMTVLLMFVAICSSVVPFVWMSSLLLIVLVPGLGYLLGTYPIDLYSTFVPHQIIDANGFSVSSNISLNFPGSVLVFLLLEAITGAPSPLVVRAFGLIYNIVVASLAFMFLRRLGIGRQAAVLGALVFVLSFYMQGVLVYTSLIGMIFYVAIAAVVLVPSTFLDFRTRTLLFMLLFSAMLVSHAFSPFMTMAAILTTLVGWKLADRVVHLLGLRRLFGDPPPTSRSILIPAVIMLAAYWMYFASLVFTWGVMRLASINIGAIFGGAASPLVSPGTIHASNYSHIASLYAPVLFGAFSIYLIAERDARKLQLLLWLLGLAGTVVFAMGGYLQEFLARIFAFAALILGYGVARLLSSDRILLRRVGILVLLAALCLHLPAHYGQDSFLVARDTALQGTEFIAEQPFSNRTINEVYTHMIYESNEPLVMGLRSFYLFSYQTQSWVTYTQGDLALQGLIGRMRSASHDRVYSNGSFEIYLQNVS